MGTKTSKTGKIILFALGLMLCADWLILREMTRQPIHPGSNLPTISASELAKYNGDNNNLPIYLALDGYVYDVSPGGADYYAPGQSYHDLVGKDSSVLLHIIGGDIISRKYKIVGVYTP